MKIRFIKLSMAVVVFSCFTAVSCGGSDKGVETPVTSDIKASDVPNRISVPGNAYITAGAGATLSSVTSVAGVTDWTASSTVISFYFKVSRAGALKVGFYGAVNSGSSTVKVTVQGKSFTVAMTGSSSTFYPVGQVDMANAGYVKVDFQGLTKTSNDFGTIYSLQMGGGAASGTNTWAVDSKLNSEGDGWEYWSRRGASVHMLYTIGSNIEYFYNEVTVPVGMDAIGTYAMTNGFGEGYCGIQVNSATERRILFSVWSPYNTDDPTTIPSDQKVTCVRKGAGVVAQEFGGEGSGGQSYLVYPWKAGVTYKILTQVKQYGISSFASYPYLTDYTAYFFDPDQNKWRLIASWRRPDTSYKTYTNAYSFLENFEPQYGWVAREATFGNQWTRNLSGSWIEVTKGTFSYDNTAAQGLRADYYGGLKDNKFDLKNCGFFSTNTPSGATFSRLFTDAVPNIDIEALKQL